MSLFRRRSGASGDANAFWSWWSSEGRELAEQSIAGRDTQDFARAMTARVHTLGDLAWALSPGEVSDHVLVITAEGGPAARAAARRAILAAPDADGAWSYVDSRPPSPEPESVVLTTGGRDIDLARVRVAARMNGPRFDVQVQHPSFADLSEQERLNVTFLALDAALGEVDTELWLGEVEPVELEPLDCFGLAALRSVVHDLKGRQLDADGRPGWTMLRGETQAGPFLAMARSPLHPLTAPHLDTYVAVLLPYAHRTEAGLPDGGSLVTLRAFEERLEEELGTSGLVLAHLSTAGVRTMHVYVDSTAGLLPAVKRVARSWDEGTARVHEMHDPGWQAVAHLRP
jgi:hypothetical protein